MQSNRDMPTPFGFVRFVRYEPRGVVGEPLSLMPVVVEKTLVDGKLRVTRITERPMRRGNLRSREWPNDLPWAPESLELRTARFDKLRQVSNPRCFQCGQKKDSWENGFVCPDGHVNLIDNRGARHQVDSDATDGYDDGAIRDGGQQYGRNAA